MKIKITKEVNTALNKGQAVVALESTIIAHGMPYPKNYRTALEVEQAVRKNGAIPATIGIINGEIIVGLSNDQIKYLAKAKDVKKVSRRDLPIVLVNNWDGATTVASTMYISKLAGINVFATGGIGGVHRDGNNSFDISSDLEELAQTDVTVVCAGAKAILDIALTLEYLETQGVPVIGFRTEKFPLFYTNTSEHKVDFKADDVLTIAKIIKTKKELRLKSGIVVANPIPKEFSLDRKYIDGIIKKALNKAEDNNVKGKDITPFLLKEIGEITDGKSLEANISLVINNADLAAKIAVQLCRLMSKKG
jgi:pseudouridine-5'-phosphate glycosidase